METTNNAQGEEMVRETQAADCLMCQNEEPNHACRNCSTDIQQEDCWKWGGCCSEECLVKAREEELLAANK